MTNTIQPAKSEQLLSVQFLKDVAICSEKYNTTNALGFDGEIGVCYSFTDGSTLKIAKEYFRFGEPKKFMEFTDARGIVEIKVKRLSEKHILSIVRSILKSTPLFIQYQLSSTRLQSISN